MMTPTQVNEVLNLFDDRSASSIWEKLAFVIEEAYDATQRNEINRKCYTQEDQDKLLRASILLEKLYDTLEGIDFHPSRMDDMSKEIEELKKRGFKFAG